MLSQVALSMARLISTWLGRETGTQDEYYLYRVKADSIHS